MMDQKTTTKTYYTDLDDAMRHVDEMIRIIKSNCKYYGVSSKPFQCKRFNFNEDEIGTRTKLISELSWWLDNDYFVSEIKMTHNNQVIIEVNGKMFYTVDQWV